MIGKDPGETFKAFIDKVEERGKSMLEALYTPFYNLYKQAARSADNFLSKEAFINLMEDCMAASTIQVLGDSTDIARSVLNKNMNALLVSVFDMITSKLNGRGWDVNGVKKQLTAATSSITLAGVARVFSVAPPPSCP